MEKMSKRDFSFWLLGYSLLMLMVGANLPSPLYSVYKNLWGFSSGMLTIIFAVYALILIPSLLLFGQISDYIGRKKVLLIGFLITFFSTVIFIFANGLFTLFLARALQGIAAGMISGTATAALIELQPPKNNQMGSLIASLATSGGTAIGPILSGVLAQYSSFPTLLPYIIHLFLLIPSFIVFWIMPETVKKTDEKKWKLQKPNVPRNIRREFSIGALVAFIAWSVTALFMSLIPSYVINFMEIQNLSIAGGVVFLMLGTSSMTQIFLKKFPIHTSMISGLLFLIGGLIGIVVAVPLHSLTLLLIGTITTGLGQGLSFMGAMMLVNKIAPKNSRGDVFSSLYVVIYLGVGIPIIGIGFGAQSVGLYNSILIYTCFIASIIMIAIIIIFLKISNVELNNKNRARKKIKSDVNK
ncbi:MULTISPECIES: MFS transporter [unclassified Bacillus cereus group]|uniref:MFS transporter n=1 Tax=unclassified Bacillus cereus group TaxID=2750818 RepID=UPI001F5A9AF6|nr:MULTISPECIES: MFS transporter [unclassified Bacillus cereus group]